VVNHGARLAAVSDEHAYRYSLDIEQRALPLSPDIGNGFFPMTETCPARSGTGSRARRTKILIATRRRRRRRRRR